MTDDINHRMLKATKSIDDKQRCQITTTKNQYW